jgi:alanine-glyoxylate transaminase/serine-glyoxylate transaminase/serine-pyruvate transaminase
MEACLVNVLEPGDEVVVGVNGVFGTRLAEVAERAGARVARVEAPWGNVIRAEQVEAALKNATSPKLVAVVHAETSTGAWQPLEDPSRSRQRSAPSRARASPSRRRRRPR